MCPRMHRPGAPRPPPPPHGLLLGAVAPRRLPASVTSPVLNFVEMEPPSRGPSPILPGRPQSCCVLPRGDSIQPTGGQEQGQSFQGPGHCDQLTGMPSPPQLHPLISIDGQSLRKDPWPWWSGGGARDIAHPQHPRAQLGQAGPWPHLCSSSEPTK